MAISPVSKSPFKPPTHRLPQGIADVPDLGLKADLSKMLVFTSAVPTVMRADATILRAYLTKPDTSSFGYGLSPPQSVSMMPGRSRPILKATPQPTRSPGSPDSLVL